MKIITFVTLFLISNYLISQMPDIDWQKTYGGGYYDVVELFVETSDGNFLIGGTSYSNASIYKSEDSHGIDEYDETTSDFWVIKVDDTGEILWENTIGGSDEEWLYGMIECPDGGFILAGVSSSDISADKTENCIGNYDYWIVKINNDGEVVWDNTIGGSSMDLLHDIKATDDGNYILAGYSGSGISGDKSETYIPGGTFHWDYWVIKINPEGNIIWQNTIGGNHDDALRVVIQTNDNGFLLGGWTKSTLGFDKTSVSFGAYDIWLIKINSAGLIEWQKTYGGNSDDYLYAMDLCSDGGYLIGAQSKSGISGVKNEGVIGGGIKSDFWVIKIDSIGNIEWQNTIGSNEYDYLTFAFESNDGNYIVGGQADFGNSGDKTDIGIGGDDYWILKLDLSGNILWQNAIGGSSDDEAKAGYESADGRLFLGGESFSGISGDKTAVHLGGGDMWITVFEGLPCAPMPEICNTLDDNCNGLIDDDIHYEINISAAGSTTFCQGISVILNATTSGPNYQWKKNGTNIPGAIFSSYTVTTKGTYTCETSSACDTELSAGIFVNVQKNPPASITAGGATTFCAGGSVILTANTGAGLSYKWYKDAVLIPGATSINYTATTAGFYKCNVTKIVSGCNKNSNGILVTVPCKAGEDLLSNSNFTIFPNPNNGTFNLIYNSSLGAISSLKGGSMGVTMLEIFNSLDQLIYSQQINSPDGKINETISINNLSSGIYFVRLGNGTVYSQQKLIIE